MEPGLLVRQIVACRVCGHDRLETVFDLGVPAISDFVQPGTEVERAPLALVRCADCGLVQLRHTVDRRRLYKTYFYRSGTNEAMVAALQEIVDEACERVRLRYDDVVADLGANDGTLLDHYPKKVQRVAVEPAVNLWGELMKHCDTLVPGFFPDSLTAQVWEYRPKVITSIAMFYDLDDPNGFVAAIKRWLHPDGIWICQLMDLEAMLAANAFDNICHEHLVYYTSDDFSRLVARHGLEVVALSRNAVNGGSLRLTIRHAKAPAAAPSSPTLDLAPFVQRVERLRNGTRALLDHLKRTDQRVLGYGASTKGNTLLQYYGLTPALTPAIADRNPDKWGKVCAGSGIKVVSEAAMRAVRPDYLLVLPWHFLESFREREQELLAQGTQLIVPLPTLRIIGGTPCQPSDARPCATVSGLTTFAT